MRIPEIVERSAAEWPDRVAVQDRIGARHVTYRDLWTRVRSGAAALRERGLTRCEPVLLVMDGSPDWPIALLSILDADLVAVPLPASTPAPLISLAARHVGAAACVTDANTRGVVSRHVALPGLTIDELTSTLLIGAADRVPAGDADDIAIIAFTSGSTAQPRAVALSHANIAANLSALLQVRQAAPDEALLSMLPPSHLYEMVAGQLAPLAAGARVVYAGTPLPNRLVDAMRTRAITYALVVPALLEAIARDVIERLVAEAAIDPSCRTAPPDALAAMLGDCSEAQRETLRDRIRNHVGPSLRTLATGGAAIDPAWSEVFAWLAIGLDVGYGLTEAGPLVAMGSTADMPRGAVGRALPGVDVRIDASGEILVRSGAVMPHYAGNALLTRDALAGGWLHTGDRGRLDANGFLFVDGRLKEAIVTAGGETIYPEEIEPHYVAPLFAEVCVVPMPDAHGNDRPALLVVAADPATDDATLNRAFAELRAAAPPRCRVTTMLRLAAPLPRTALGKIRRRALAATLSTQQRAS